jgi:protein-S-isoprenylcysteine O-methyltransferase Ste14
MTAKRGAAHTSRWRIFEVVVGVPALVGVALQRAVPLSLPGGAPRPVFLIAGGALIVAGLATIVMARRELGRHGQPTDPGRATSRVVTSGIFAISRNPLYLGGVTVVLGLGLAFNQPWILLMLVPAVVACNRILIAPEERYLAEKFGDEYSKYVSATRRWIGRRAGSA